MSKFVDYLNQEFEKRLKSNAKYSMNAFAQYLDINSGSFSEVLRKKRNLGLKKFDEICDKFKLTEEEITDYRENLISYNGGKSDFQSLEEVELEIIDNPHYSIILNLVSVVGFCDDPEWVAKAINRDVEVCEEALARLFELGLLVKNEEGQFESSKKRFVGDLATEEMKLHYISTSFDNAKDALYNVSRDKSFATSLVLSIDSSRMDEMKEELRDVVRKFMHMSDTKEKNYDEIYQLLISLSPLTQVQ
ncbi:hypothetical protein A9Q84_15405 [Halobacteriovorax marinus]|uniref:DUF4423 domain-containing protein n=1 Tax=Halobacteriovorax marinus TaxID=97084 RepID=A0A1Y5F3U0_9BACT|nr:hypothetical protein A9Q84_15405 [Halobacteriovorax marinus]